MNTKTKAKEDNTSATAVSAAVIKLGLDVHARQITVCRQLDDSTPQPPQRFEQPRLLAWIKAQLQTGARCYTCYEAGPLGYTLHRELTALGASNCVIAPQRLDGGKGQKTDKLDARALVERLDRYVRGNTRAFSVVRVPSPEQEQARAQARLREQLSRMRRQAEARGRSLLLTHGRHVLGPWWRPARWAALAPTLPEWLRELMTTWQKHAQALDAEERALRTKLEAGAPAALPKGVGALTWVILAREVLDWSRFKNRRQVASYTGLCPTVHTSDGRGRQGSINRCGNRAVRGALLELVWRLARWQPDYPPVRLLVDKASLSPRRRRKQAVAAARKLAIDLWRLATGQATPEKLGLRVPSPA
jgi:transposase